MSRRLDLARILELLRFYQAAALNALFGFAMFALLIWLGMNLFLAQIVAHCIGVAFNYVTYSRHVFRGSAPAKKRFVASYAVNYLIGLACLALVSRFIASPYLAGLAAMVLASVVNYLMLKRFVFIRPAA